MSFFRRIFSKQPKLDPISLSEFGTDFHSHLIPGIDDGAPDMESAVEMIRRMQELGYKKIITTPHVMCDYYKNTPDIILKGLEDVRNTLAKENIAIDIEAAAEYNLDDGLGDLIKNKQILTFGDNHVLFELPFMNEPKNLQSIIFDFQMAGYRPILAHPERYTFWYKNEERYEELKAGGVLFQLNLLSLAGHYSPETRKVSERMVDAGLIDGVGTDCHRMDHLQLINNHLSSKHMHILAEKENLLNKKFL